MSNERERETPKKYQKTPFFIDKMGMRRISTTKKK
jgi:hypothetical protein